MALRRLGPLAVVLVSLAGCASSSLPEPISAAAEAATRLPTCPEAWARIPEERRSYDFAADAQPSPQGNLGYREFAARLPREGCRKAWTVLVYMAADNHDMPPYAYWHLHGMEAAFPEPKRSAASSPEADVLVQLDLDKPAGIRRLHIMRSPDLYDANLDAHDFERYTPAEIRSPVVELMEEETLAPGESLRRFLDWGVTRYPADRYMVIVWGHGLGWRPAGLPGDSYDRALLRGGIAFDESQRTVLDTPGLRDALAAVERDRLGGHPIDVYASDACLMQSLEVATELADVSRYVVGSEQIEDYLGFPYRTFLPALNGTAPAPPAPATCTGENAACRVAAMLPAFAREAFRAGGIYARVSAAAARGFTLSAVETRALEGEARLAMQELGAAISVYVREEPLRAIDVQTLLGDTPGFLGGSRDAGVFLTGLRDLVEEEARRNGEAPTATAVQLLQAISTARTALDRAVLTSAFGAEYDAPRFAGKLGVSVWLPHDPEELSDRLGFFASAHFYRAPGMPPEESPWSAWLKLVFTPP